MYKYHLKKIMATGMALVLLLSLFGSLPVYKSSCEVQAATTYPNDNSGLGTNLTSVNYYSAEQPFIDIFKHAKKWMDENNAYYQDGELNVDENGWVKSIPAGKIVQTTLPADKIQSSGFILLYNGEGTIEFRSATITKQSAGRIEFTVAAGKSLGIKITSLPNPSNYIRNIKVIRKEDEGIYQTQTFNPKFLDNWKMFKVLRFMDWGETNDSEIASWSQRTLPTDYTQGNFKGVAIEYMVELCNTINADLWICIPHLADNNYVTQCATLIKDTLKPNLKVFVEYSNECWNGNFSQAGYCMNMGLSLDLDTNGELARTKYYSKRSVETLDLFNNVFSAQTDRLIRVLAAQAANSTVAQLTVDYNDAYMHADTLAIAPYFAGRIGRDPYYTQYNVAGWASNSDYTSLFNWIENSSDNSTLAGVRQNVDQHKSIADAKGLHLITYEGGQHLVGGKIVDSQGKTINLQNDPVLTEFFTSANRKSKMKDIYTKYLNNWKNDGGKLFMNFSSTGEYGKYGSWGLLENMYQDKATAYKYQAVTEFISSNPRWFSSLKRTSGTQPTPTPTSTPTPTPTSTPTPTLFSDGFESGNYTTGGWVCKSGCEIKNTGAYEGTYCSAINYNDYMEKAVSTSGSSNIQVKYVCKSEGVASTGQFISEWYDGSTWNTIESITGYTSSSYQVKSFSLPAAAANKIGFQLRFRCSNAGSGRVYIDNVQVIAQ